MFVCLHMISWFGFFDTCMLLGTNMMGAHFLDLEIDSVRDRYNYNNWYFKIIKYILRTYICLVCNCIPVTEYLPVLFRVVGISAATTDYFHY